MNSLERPTSDDLRRAVYKLMAALRSGTLERSEWEAAKGKLESVLAEPGDVPYRGVVLDLLHEMRGIEEETLLSGGESVGHMPR